MMNDQVERQHERERTALQSIMFYLPANLDILPLE
jgi:hypothetical protein